MPQLKPFSKLLFSLDFCSLLQANGRSKLKTIAFFRLAGLTVVWGEDSENLYAGHGLFPTVQISDRLTVMS